MLVDVAHVCRRLGVDFLGDDDLHVVDVGIDLAVALRACVEGRRWTGPTDLEQGRGQCLARFPQEWYGEPESRWLTTLSSDAPWHDPRLFEAMLKIPYANEPRRAARVTSPGP